MKGRRLLALAAPLVAVAAGAVSFAYFVPDYSQRVAATANVAPSKDAYTLRAGDELDSAALDGMAHSLQVAPLRAVLNDRTRLRGRWGGTCGGAARVPSGASVFCFNAVDNSTTEWDPQGIASNSSIPERPLLVSWYDEDRREPDRSARVTFINTKTGTYRHVLLVWPYRNAQGRTDYEPAGIHSTDTGIHAGGMAWYGNRLYVADSGTGLRVFDMRRIFDLGRSQNGSLARRDLVGLHGNTYHAYGYRYVMPQVYSYVPNKQSGEACTTEGTPDHSWLSLNGASLVTGEWCKNNYGRVAQYPLTDAVGNGALVTDSKGQAVPSWVARLPASYIQGGATANGKWWFTRGVPPGTGELLQASWADGFKNVQRQAISYGPEDLSCQRGDRRIWTLAEYPGRRAIYGLPQASC